MAIWNDKNGTANLDTLNGWAAKDMTGRQGMVYTEIGEDYLRARIPVDERWTQAYGIWHGGASCVVAEAMGSVGCVLCIDQETHYCVGVEINASHLRSEKQGHVTAEARPLRVGRSMHVWETRLWNDAGKLMCVARLTTTVLKR